MKAILSVYDKTGIQDLARGLVALGAEVYSTGGTLAALERAGLPARSISELTGFPEILEGRVKTLHPMVHGGILARRDRPKDLEEIARHGIETIDLVAVNLYPFAEAVRRPGADLDTALENIDVGGPTMIRAAAKNFPDVLVLTDPADYEPVLAELGAGEVSLETRRRLAARAFAHVSAYDSLVATYLYGPDALFPDILTIPLEKVQDLRYGENPHQRAALYRQVTTGAPGLVDRIQQLGGRELSYNNVVEASLAVSTVFDFLTPTVAVLKHGNPCGLATRPNVVEAYELALSGDPISAFGGVVGVNREVGSELAEAISMTHYDLIVAPAFTAEAREVLTRKKNLRLLEVGEVRPAWELGARPETMQYRRVSGGFLAQTPDALAPDEVSTTVVTRRRPTLEETTDLLFAWRAVKHVSSNAIVLVKHQTLVGMGAGQPSRVDSVRIAADKAGVRAEGSVLASDALFPFPDGVEVAAKAGATAVIQPGGSVRDAQVIAVADELGLAMVFTGRRHFRH